jgi:hypothetical protein
MTVMLGSPIGWLLDEALFLPLWIRPWVLILLFLLLLWFVLFRSGVKLIVVVTLRLLALTGLVVLTVPLAMEYVDTQRRRSAGKRPGRIAFSVSEVFDGFSLSLAAADRRLAGCHFKTRKWPCRTMALLAVGGIVSWIVLGTSPALAAPTKFPGKAYGLWQDFEQWAGGTSGDPLVPGGEAAPVLLVRKSSVVLSTSAAHAGEIAQVGRAGKARKPVRVILDANGNGVIQLNRSNAGIFVRGGNYLVQAKNLRVLVRLL